MVFKTSQDYEEELKQRQEDNPKFAAALQVNGTNRFLKAISDRLIDGGNVCINMFAPPNHGKSNSMRKLARIIIRFLVALKYNVSMEMDVKFTRTYPESLVKFAERAKSTNWETPIIVIQDEKLRMTGPNRIIATRNLMNNLDTFRALKYCYLLCYCDYWKKVITRESFANMGFLILEGIRHDWEGVKQNCFVWWTREGPVCCVYVDFEEDNKVYDVWKIEEQRRTTSNLGAAGGHMTDFDALAQQIISRLQQTPQLSSRENLKLQDFKGLVRLMHESGEIIASDSDENYAAWWAWCNYTAPQGISCNRPTVHETQSEPQRILANGGDIQPDPLPEEDYQALRQIALEEYKKAIGPTRATDVPIVLREFYYPMDAEADDHWGEPEVFSALRPYYEELKQKQPLSGSLGHKYRTYRRFIDNNTSETIGARYIKWKLDHADLPIQISPASGPGHRDISFLTKDGKLIASANVKHFLHQANTEFIVSPEYQDPVYYIIVVRVKPFTLKAYRGPTPGKERVAEGELKQSVWDLGWSGFVEDLRKEAEKARQP